MRTKHVIEKDKKKRSQVLKTEMTRILLLSIIYNTGCFKKYRIFASYLLQTQARNNSYVRLKNFCVLTGRSKGVYRKFRLSRIKIRELLSKGELINYRKVT